MRFRTRPLEHLQVDFVTVVQGRCTFARVKDLDLSRDWIDVNDPVLPDGRAAFQSLDDLGPRH